MKLYLFVCLYICLLSLGWYSYISWSAHYVSICFLSLPMCCLFSSPLQANQQLYFVSESALFELFKYASTHSEALVEALNEEGLVAMANSFEQVKESLSVPWSTPAWTRVALVCLDFYKVNLSGCSRHSFLPCLTLAHACISIVKSCLTISSFSKNKTQWLQRTVWYTELSTLYLLCVLGVL